MTELGRLRAQITMLTQQYVVLSDKLAAFEAQRKADAKTVADARRHVATLCRATRRALNDNRDLRLDRMGRQVKEANAFVSEPLVNRTASV